MCPGESSAFPDPRPGGAYPSAEHIYKPRYGACGHVQLSRYDGWVTELVNRPKQERARRDLGNPSGFGTIFFTPLTPISVAFADLALASPADYRREGQGSLLRACLNSPGDPWISRKTRKSSPT